MSLACKYKCGKVFSHRSSRSRHENGTCNLNNETLQSTINSGTETISDVCVESNVSELIENRFKQLTNMISELQKKVEEQPAPIVIQPTFIYNFLDQNTIDIFGKVLELHGSDRAISYSCSLLKNKSKGNKHEWVKNAELVDPEGFKLVVKYDSKAQQGFEIVGADRKVIKDPDGLKLDKILTDTVINANLKAQSQLARKASEAFEAGDENKMWSVWTDSSIFNPKGETIHDQIDKFKKMPASKKHLIDIVSSNKD
jgi:hypothetical protein